MPTTKRDQILDALLTRMTTVHAGAVRNTVRLLDDDLPALCLWDSAESGGVDKFGRQSCNLQVNVAMGKRLAVADNPSKIANEMIGQIVKYAIGTDSSLGGLANATRYQSSQISYPEPGGDWVIGVDVAFVVDYTTVLGNPYS